MCADFLCILECVINEIVSELSTLWCVESDTRFELRKA